jgi:hypothetical protein
MNLLLPFQFIVIIAVDVVILLLLLLLILRRNENKKNLQHGDLSHIEHLKSSLQQLMENSSAVSCELVEAMDVKTKELTLVLEKLTVQERKLSDSMTRAQEMTKIIDRKEAPDDQKSQDPYSKATELLSKGHSIEFVCRESGLSQTEIDLLKNIIPHQR